MFNFKLRVTHYGLALAIMLFPAFAGATVKDFNPKTDCGLLTDHAVLLVYALEGKISLNYQPMYEKISNDPKYKKWTFYSYGSHVTYYGLQKYENNLLCNREASTPALFVNNETKQISISDLKKKLTDFDSANKK